MKVVRSTFLNKYTLVFILLILICSIYYFRDIREGLAPGPASQYSSSKEKCGEFTIQNRKISNTLTSNTSNMTLQGIDAQIKDCVDLYTSINEQLPLSINDITVGSFTQTKSANTNPLFTIAITKPIIPVRVTSPSPGPSPSPSPSPNGSTIQEELNETETETARLEAQLNAIPQGAKWTIYGEFAMGSQGPQGPQGIQGPQGSQGAQGAQGMQGSRGTGGKTNFNEPFTSK